MLANCPTPLADERLVPPSVLSPVSRMIVPPEESYEENESCRREPLPNPEIRTIGGACSSVWLDAGRLDHSLP